MNDNGNRLGTAELRTLFLFEALDEDQLRWLAERGRVERWQGGAVVCGEGEPATGLIVLLSGAVALTRRLRGDEVEVVRTDQRGVYAGATNAYLGEQVKQVYGHTVRAVSDVELFVLPAGDFAAAMRSWFPMALHLLEGLFFAARTNQTIIGERERLVALGALSAGLTHELNNPAAAAVRATAVLRERVTAIRHKLAVIADGRLDCGRLHNLAELQDSAVRRAATAAPLPALAAADAEDEVSDWLEEHGVSDGWELSPMLVAAGAEVPWLTTVVTAVGEDSLDPALHWLAYSVDTEMLMGEIDEAVGRISRLVGAAKQYSQLDRASNQDVDVHELLDATLVMLHGKIPSGVRVVKEYDRTLPRIPAFGAELNQVWTNLVDNAIAAMEGGGTLTVRTRRDHDRLVVEVADTGSGIPDEVRPHIFEPFFTTKPVGEGTGLGLDISYRIVVNRHHGDIRVESQPGDTRFLVRLPMAQPPQAAAAVAPGAAAGTAAP